MTGPSNNPPRKHHFLPCFYTKHWTGDDGRLVEYSRPHQSVKDRRRFPKETGFEYDLYSFNELPPDIAQFVESHFLKYADGEATKALDNHLGVAAHPWTSELMSSWSRFLVGAHVRHPVAMSELRPAAKQIWDASGKETQKRYEETREPHFPPTFDEYWAERDPLIPIKARVNQIIAAFDNEVLGAHFNQMHHAVIDVSQASERLLTSDRPLAIYGLAKPDGFLSIPISPTKVFMAANDQQTFANVRQIKPTDLVRRINNYVVKRARLYVYAADKQHDDFINNHMSDELEPLPLFPNLGVYPQPLTK